MPHTYIWFALSILSLFTYVIISERNTAIKLANYSAMNLINCCSSLIFMFTATYTHAPFNYFKTLYTKKFISWQPPRSGKLPILLGTMSSQSTEHGIHIECCSSRCRMLSPCEFISLWRGRQREEKQEGEASKATAQIPVSNRGSRHRSPSFHFPKGSDTEAPLTPFEASALAKYLYKGLSSATRPASIA